MAYARFGGLKEMSGGDRSTMSGTDPQVTAPSLAPNPNAPNAPWTTPLTPVPGGTPGVLPPVPPLPVVVPSSAGPEPAVTGGDQDIHPLSTDLVGDIPPPPVPPPPPITGVGVAGINGTEGSTFARPGGSGITPFHTSAFNPKPTRFGPGVPVTGGATDVTGLGLDPDKAAEILRNLVAGRQG